VTYSVEKTADVMAEQCRYAYIGSDVADVDVGFRPDLYDKSSLAEGAARHRK
jgi:hypothetical protein